MAPYPERKVGHVESKLLKPKMAAVGIWRRMENVPEQFLSAG